MCLYFCHYENTFLSGSLRAAELGHVIFTAELKLVEMCSVYVECTLMQQVSSFLQNLVNI
jgi:hypothetical protein